MYMVADDILYEDSQDSDVMLSPIIPWETSMDSRHQKISKPATSQRMSILYFITGINITRAGIVGASLPRVLGLR